MVSDKEADIKFIADGMNAFQRNTKRVVDCLLALVAMILFSPLFALCYIMVKREDGGPAIFRQERIGRFGRPFTIYKFRSMKVEAEESEPLLLPSGNENSRLTKIGRFLRKHHLDELPQLWNVFIGDMAFVGPRPERARPGVTSYATLYNGYTDTMEKMLIRLQYDLDYLENRSWALDATILLKTFLYIVFGKNF